MTIVFPLAPCADHYPLLAIQDGRLGDMVEQAGLKGFQVMLLVSSMDRLYPNGCDVDRTPLGR